MAIRTRSSKKSITAHVMDLLLASCVSCAAALVGACAGDSEGGSAAPTPPGALPCDGLAIDCRLAFSDTYDGTYEGGTSGRFTLHVDVLGGIQGTGTGVVSITGQVDEYGRAEFAFSDGTAFVGQFKADHHSLDGTWKSSAGKTGTFHAESATVAATEGSGGSAGTNTAPGNGGAAPGTAPSSNSVIVLAEQACQVVVSCGKAEASSCPVASGLTESDVPPACRNEEIAFYTCIIANKCSSDVACRSQSGAINDCLMDVLTGLSSSTGTYPDNPSFNPPLTGTQAFDDAVHLCTECTAEAKACYASQACKDHALCLEACSEDDLFCSYDCDDANHAGAVLRGDALTCQMLKC